VVSPFCLKVFDGLRLVTADSVQRKSFAKVDPPHLYVIPQLVRCSGAEDPSFGDYVCPVGYAERLANIMVGNQNADAARFQVEDDLLQFQDGDRVDPAERLIEQDELGLDAQRPGDLNPSPLSARERVAARHPDVADVQLADQTLGPFAPFSVAQGLTFEDRQDVLFHRQFPEDRRLLRQITDAIVACPQVHGHSRDVGVVDFDTPGLRRNQAHNHVEARGFASAVGPQESDHFAARDSQVNPAHHLPALISFADTLGDQRFHSGCEVALQSGTAALQSKSARQTTISAVVTWERWFPWPSSGPGLRY